MSSTRFSIDTAITCTEQRHHTSNMRIHASADGSHHAFWSLTVIIITIIIIIIMITIILIVILSSLPPSGPFSSLCTTYSSLFSPAVFSTGGRINIHLGPYTGLVSDGVSGRAVWRLQTQWPAAESRERKHSYTQRASKDHPFSTRARTRTQHTLSEKVGWERK